MTEEIIDIVTETGEATKKTALKSEVHKFGLPHNTAHIWLYTSKNEILLQQRAKTKLIYPLLWDVSVAGHIDSGETITQGALRELHEEIGLVLKEENLTKIGIFKCFKDYNNGFIDNEFHHTFIAQLSVSISELTPQKEEVEHLKLVTFNEFEELLKSSSTNNHFIASNSKYYLEILQHIKKQNSND